MALKLPTGHDREYTFVQVRLSTSEAEKLEEVREAVMEERGLETLPRSTLLRAIVMEYAENFFEEEG